MSLKKTDKYPRTIGGVVCHNYEEARIAYNQQAKRRDMVTNYKKQWTRRHNDKKRGDEYADGIIKMLESIGAL
jgi:hypothetical protein